MLWEDEAAYYDPPGGVLRYEPDLPMRLVHPPDGMTARGHIELVEYQLDQIGAAFGLAFALGRKLVLPRIVCGFDKAWFPLDSPGMFAGAPRWMLPIEECPLDHVLEPSQLRAYQTVREFSFLENLRTPETVRRSRAATAINVDEASTELERLGREFGKVKVLTISNLAALARGNLDLFGLGVLTTAHAKEMEHAGLHHVGGGWCCAPTLDPGPKHHDFQLPLMPRQGVVETASDE